MFYHIFKIKWPKSEEYIEIGGLENLGALHQHFSVFFCKKYKNMFFPIFAKRSGQNPRRPTIIMKFCKA